MTYAHEPDGRPLASGVSEQCDSSLAPSVSPQPIAAHERSRRCDSPSASALRPDAQPVEGVFELKLRVSSSQADQIRQWALINLHPDTHADPQLEFGYFVNTLYLDSPRFEVYHRDSGFRQQKYRLRRYGAEHLVWLELKRKVHGRVTKRRTTIQESEVDRLRSDSSNSSDDWSGDWFREHITGQQLRPTCRVTYHRFAAVGQASSGPIRLTLDRQLACDSASGWQIPTQPLARGCGLEQDQILELKFRDALPVLFRDLIAELQILPANFSKYRHSVEACIPLSDLVANRS